MKEFLYIFTVAAWIFGVILAKGFWSTLVSAFFPPWAFYLAIERTAIFTGFIK